MTQPQKRALFSLTVWGAVLITFIIIFFSGGGPATYVHSKSRILHGAILFAVGYLGYLLMLYLTRIRPDARPLVKDERDERVAKQANGAALIALLFYIYVTCIVLYIVYGDSGAVPVGWMWFLAYSTAFLGYVAHAAATLLLDLRMSGHGEG